MVASRLPVAGTEIADLSANTHLKKLKKIRHKHNFHLQSKSCALPLQTFQLTQRGMFSVSVLCCTFHIFTTAWWVVGRCFFLDNSKSSNCQQPLANQLGSTHGFPHNWSLPHGCCWLYRLVWPRPNQLLVNLLLTVLTCEFQTMSRVAVSEI